VTTVIIPAYNEAASIERTLKSVLASADATSAGAARADATDLESTGAEVIVVCNGCTDDTADRARRFGSRVRVIETPVGSKTHAMNLGDEAATSYPRIYLDADVVVSKTFIADLTRALDGPEPRVAYPDVVYDLADSSSPVRAFYDVWRSMPYNRPGRIGVGVYALNRSGRARFDRFPSVISDDGFVRGQFTEHECRVVDTCTTTVQAPATLGALVKIKTRSRLGLYQLRRSYPEVLKRHASQLRSTQPRSTSPAGHDSGRRRPRRISGMPVYLLVNAVTRLRAARQSRALDGYRWERDETTRRELVMEQVG
jgi:glycosyltransferase involved in cell wall biosynthesis